MEMAPPVAEIEGFRMVIHTLDHEPAHVHVQRDGADLRVYLEGKRAAERVYGRMSAANERRAIALVHELRDALLAEWIRRHR